MRNLASLGFLLALTAMLVGAWTSTAHAYLDRGTGSIILQVLLGGVAGLALAGKLYWQKINLPAPRGGVLPASHPHVLRTAV